MVPNVSLACFFAFGYHKTTTMDDPFHLSLTPMMQSINQSINPLTILPLAQTECQPPQQD